MAGELRGESDISSLSSSAFRFREAAAMLLYGDAAKGLENAILGSLDDDDGLLRNRRFRGTIMV